jgi:hypothetical protein
MNMWVTSVRTEPIATHRSLIPSPQRAIKGSLSTPSPNPNLTSKGLVAKVREDNKLLAIAAPQPAELKQQPAQRLT